MASMGKPETNVGELCTELGISRQTLYRHVSPTGEIRADGTRVLNRKEPSGAIGHWAKPRRSRRAVTAGRNATPGA
jgi:predicted site-specific integrase-resolvase